MKFLRGKLGLFIISCAIIYSLATFAGATRLLLHPLHAVFFFYFGLLFLETAIRLNQTMSPALRISIAPHLKRISFGYFFIMLTGMMGLSASPGDPLVAGLLLIGVVVLIRAMVLRPKLIESGQMQA